MSDAPEMDDQKVRRGTTTTGVGYNDVTLYEYFEARIKALRELVDVQFAAAQAAISKAEISTQTALAKTETSTETRIRSLRELSDQRFDNAQVAIDKADIANEKRFENMNEFRGQLADQSRTFVNRDTLDAGIREIKASVVAQSLIITDQGSRLSNIEGRVLAYTGSIAFISIVFNILLHYWK